MDEATEPLGSRIRKGKLEKVPYIVVVGDDDVTNRTVGVNRRGSDAPDRGIALEGFIASISAEIESHGSPELAR